MTAHDRQRGAQPVHTGAAASPTRRGTALEPEHAAVHHGKRFLEHARSDPWRANIVLQLAELAGDQIDSLPDYIDMLLATFSLALSRGELDPERREIGPGDPRVDEHAKYYPWFSELGMLELAS